MGGSRPVTDHRPNAPKQAVPNLSRRPIPHSLPRHLRRHRRREPDRPGRRNTRTAAARPSRGTTRLRRARPGRSTLVPPRHRSRSRSRLPHRRLHCRYRQHARSSIDRKPAHRPSSRRRHAPDHPEMRPGTKLTHPAIRISAGRRRRARPTPDMTACGRARRPAPASPTSRNPGRRPWAGRARRLQADPPTSGRKPLPPRDWAAWNSGRRRTGPRSLRPSCRPGRRQRPPLPNPCSLKHRPRCRPPPCRWRPPRPKARYAPPEHQTRLTPGGVGWTSKTPARNLAGRPRNSACRSSSLSRRPNPRTYPSSPAWTIRRGLRLRRSPARAATAACRRATPLLS